MTYVISYDICNTKRRNKISKILLDYGIRVQYSVFECDINKKQITEIKAKIMEVIDKKKDKVNVYYLCHNCYKRKVTLGLTKKCVFEEDVIIL